MRTVTSFHLQLPEYFLNTTITTQFEPAYRMTFSTGLSGHVI